MNGISLLFISLFAMTPAFARGRLEVATPELLAEELPGVPWESVGLVLIKKTKKTRVYSTGFFLSPTLFVVADSPFIEEESKACQKETFIFTGKLKVQPDFDLESVKPNYRCKQIIKNNVWRGYEVWKVEALGDGLPITEIPLLTNAIAEATGFDPTGEKTAVLGYAFGENGAELKMAIGCRFKHLDSPFSQADLSGQPDLKKVQLDWSSVACPLDPGMQGGPIFARVRRGGWFAVGIATGTAMAAEQGTLILTPFLPRVTEFFGGYLTGEKQ